MAGPHPDGTGVREVGITLLNGRRLAIPARNIREVVPWPARPGGAHCTHPAALGTVAVRGATIPVLALDTLLGEPAREAPPRSVVVVLRQEGWLLGVRVDAVRGLDRVHPDELQELRCASAEASLVPLAFVREEESIPLLDPAALFALPAIPQGRERQLAPASAASAGGGDQRSFLIVEVDRLRLAIDTTRVAATFDAARLRPSQVPLPGWSDVADYLGREFPVFDSLAVFGMTGEPATSGIVLALRIGDALVGWRVDRLIRIVDASGAEVQALALNQFEDRFAAVRATIAIADAPPAMLLDDAALSDNAALLRMAALCKASGTLHDGADRSRQHLGHLIFREKERYGAIRLDRIRRIERASDAHLQHLPPGKLVALAQLRDGAMPVARAFGDAEPLEDTALILVPAGATAALSVEAICTISYATPSGAPGDSLVPFLDETVDGVRRAVEILPLA